MPAAMEAVAPTAIDRTRLLPRSGIGVDGAWLVIAPPGNPIIRLDARLLDRVELIGRSPTGPLIASGLATAAARKQDSESRPVPLPCRCRIGRRTVPHLYDAFGLSGFVG